jgi:hypothetical protein
MDKPPTFLSISGLQRLFTDSDYTGMMQPPFKIALQGRHWPPRADAQLQPQRGAWLRQPRLKIHCAKLPVAAGSSVGSKWGEVSGFDFAPKLWISYMKRFVCTGPRTLTTKRNVQLASAWNRWDCPIHNYRIYKYYTVGSPLEAAGGSVQTAWRQSKGLGFRV